MRRPLTLLSAAALAAGTAAAVVPASAARLLGPPWIAIEYPANPYDRENRGAFLYVHTFHHNNAIDATLRGSAEGLVTGQRRTVALQFARTSRPGTYALRRQWPAEGTWMLVITTQAGGRADGATALVDIGPAGEVAGVRVPTETRDGWQVPLAVTRQQIDEALRARATAVAAAQRAGR